MFCVYVAATTPAGVNISITYVAVAPSKLVTVIVTPVADTPLYTGIAQGTKPVTVLLWSAVHVSDPSVTE